MSALTIEYGFSAEPWQHAGPGGWYFISLPKKLSAEIRSSFKSEEQGWGRLPVSARIGKTRWQSAIWFDTKAGTYLLPLKAEVRTKEKIMLGKRVEVKVFI